MGKKMGKKRKKGEKGGKRAKKIGKKGKKGKICRTILDKIFDFRQYLFL